jgi:hypothetical protein
VECEYHLVRGPFWLATKDLLKTHATNFLGFAKAAWVNNPTRAARQRAPDRCRERHTPGEGRTPHGLTLAHTGFTDPVPKLRLIMLVYLASFRLLYSKEDQ